MSKPSRVRVRLGEELRLVRDLAGISGRDLAARAGLTQSKVSRAERGDALLSVPEVTAWLEAADAAIVDRDRAFALTEAAHSETRSWRDMQGDATHLQQLAAEREAGATAIYTLCTNMVPGLLQTAQYARLVIPQTDLTGSTDHPAAQQARMDRQRVLFEDGRSFRFLVEQAALEWAPGPGVMPAQLDRLQQLATLPTVSLGVLPSPRVADLSWHSFVLYLSPEADAPPYVTTELVHGGQVIADPDTVALYAAQFERLWRAAATGADAVQKILRARRVW